MYINSGQQTWLVQVQLYPISPVCWKGNDMVREEWFNNLNNCQLCTPNILITDIFTCSSTSIAHFLRCANKSSEMAGVIKPCNLCLSRLRLVPLCQHLLQQHWWETKSKRSTTYRPGPRRNGIHRAAPKESSNCGNINFLKIWTIFFRWNQENTGSYDPL